MKKHFIGCLLLILCSCNTANNGYFQAKNIKKENIELNQVFLEDLNQFSIDSILKIQNEKNIIFSPIAHFVSSASVYSIANSNIQNYLNLFHFHNQEELIDAVHNTSITLHSNQENGIIQLTNALLFSGNYNQETMNDLTNRLYYTAIDYRNQNLQKNINDWINQASKGIYKEISLADYRFDSDDELVFLNSLYLDLKFNVCFSANSNKEMNFYNNGTEPVLKTFMKSENYSNYYVKNDDFESFSLQLENSNQVHFMLPNSSKKIKDVYEKHSFEEVFSIHKYGNIKCKVTLPKFNLEQKVDLTNLYEKQNILLDNYQCKLTNLSYDSINLSQQNQITLNEEGIKAVSLNVNYQYPQEEEKFEIVVDRPFSFLIEDANGFLLYYGEVYTL